MAGERVLNGTRRQDGKEQLEAFARVPLTIPTYTESLTTAKEWVRSGLLVWGRRWVHQEGTDIIGPGYRPARRTRVEKWNRIWSSREWFVQVIPAADIAQEWRIHIFNGRSIGRALKHQTGDPTRVQPVRNRANGWTMRHDVDPPEDLRDVAKKAVKAVGYNFGAVDILRLTDGRNVVLEVNSAPALRSDYTLGIYVSALQRVAAGRWTEWRE